jgi:hypothetical protein
MQIALSVRGVPIRLTDERWRHIVNAHDEMAGYYDDCLHAIEEPDWVLAGSSGSLKAIRAYGRKRFLVVLYRELSRHDGFVITAYFTRSLRLRASRSSSRIRAAEQGHRPALVPGWPGGDLGPIHAAAQVDTLAVAPETQEAAR